MSKARLFPNKFNQHLASLLLFLAALAAFLLANHSVGQTYFKHFTHLPVGIILGKIHIVHSLKDWIENALMVLFFYLIGLELKKEVIDGELQDPKILSTLALSALCGILVSAGTYMLLNAMLHLPYQEGWAIPISTDTSIAIAVLALLRKFLPKSALSFLLGLAIFDDIYSLLIIAFYYSDNYHLDYMLYAVVALIGLCCLNVLKYQGIFWYVMTGIALWLCLERAGFHGTLAGFIVALLTPVKTASKHRDVISSSRELINELEGINQNEGATKLDEKHHLMCELEREAKKGMSPLKRFEHILDMPVTMVILPLYAFTNAGIRINQGDLIAMFHHPLFFIISGCLLIAKPLGIYMGARLAAWMSLGHLPSTINSRVLIIVSCLSGIGFTMSIYITNLSLDHAYHIKIAKLAIMLSMLISIVMSCTLVYWGRGKRR